MEPSSVPFTILRGFTALQKFGCRGVAQLLVKCGADADARDSQDRTPLWYATESNQGEIVQLLLSKSVDINAKDANHKTISHNVARTVT